MSERILSVDAAFAQDRREVPLPGEASVMQAERPPRATADTHMADPPPYAGTPRWAKVFGIIAIGLVLLIAVMVFTGVGGPHGPGRHIPSGDSGTPPQHGVQRP